MKKGLRLDEIELDLSGLSGLIALSGKNGSSKTTILEALHPFRTLASRKRALPYHVFLRDSARELDFDFQGDSYRTKILIDCDSGRQEGYAWKNGQSMVDGKARNYDNYITDLFGSKDLFFNSIFCAQNAQKLSDLTTGKLKELFSEFLQLHKYIAYESTVKQCLGALTAQSTAYGRQAEGIREQLAGFGDLKTKLAKTAGEKAGEKARLTNIRDEIKEVESSIVTAKEKIAANAAIEDRAEDFKGRISDTHKAITDEGESYNGRVFGLRSDLQKVKAEITAFDITIGIKEAIEAAVEKKAALDIEIDEKQATLDRGNGEFSEIIDRIYQHDQIVRPGTEPHKYESHIPILKERIRNAKTQVRTLDTWDPGCPSTICGLSKPGLEAEEALKKMEPELETYETIVAEHNMQAGKAQKEAAIQRAAMKDDKKTMSALVDGLKTSISEMKTERDKCARQAARHDDLKVAIAQKETAEKRAKELTYQGMKEKAAFDVNIEQLKAKIERLRQYLNSITEKIDLSAKDRLTELEIVHQKKSDQGKYILDQINALEADIQQCRKDIERRNTYREQQAEINLKQASIQNQLNEWNYLKNAVSKDGLRALEIDSVAPSISAYANQILLNTFGPAYSVKLRTQDDEGRETLDILAIEEDGRETFLDDLSGGERVWSLKALRLAMTLISKEKSGKAFQTAMADEEDGPLDTGNARNFIQLYRSFMETGGFESCYFISHRPECIELADSVLEFGNGGISIN